ncbi:MAG: methionine--tRNA ligase [Bdellovibrionota bacterium]
MEPRKILVTAALPYANGYIHLGHLVEYLQADFWTRFQNLRGNDCAYICADDTHGTPIMVRAREMGITPEQLIADSWKEHTKDFSDFQIEFAHYSSTNSEENKKLCEEFYSQMKEKKHISRKNIKQLYCNHDKMFLPDRFVKGTCPKCGSKDQYGDSCDVCSSTYSPADLKDQHCSICGTTPVDKDSEHVFFELNSFKEYLREWLPKHTSPEINNKMLEWFNEDLRPWDISRDEPYFGFAIPGENKKFFYVWVDAPMGYVSSTLQWCKKTGRNFDEYWKSEKHELYHFIGKDIVYFHTLFWPALLKTAGFRSPTAVWVHGRLMINGEKMSKSKGTMVPARCYLNHLNPTYLRYYYATKLNSSLDDFDLNMEDFTSRVNSDLIGKITNLASRGAQMLNKKFNSEMSECDPDGLKLVKRFQSQSEIIAAHFEGREFAKATSEIRALADEANRYFDEKTPWKTIDTNPTETQKVLTSTLNLFRILAIYLKAFLPVFAAKAEKLIQEKPWKWSDSQKILSGQKIEAYKHLANRIEPEKVKAMMDESQKINQEISVQRTKASTAPTAETTSKATATAPSTTAAGTPAEIEIDDFMKVDLRIAKIISAEAIPEADKLLKLQVDIGDGKPRQIFAGIKAAYKPEDLIGRLTVVVANLKPRKMKFGMSEGMVLAAGPGGSELFILSPDSGALPGQRVK